MELFGGVSNLGDKLGRAAQGDPMAIVAVIGGSLLAGIVVMILYFFLRRKATRIARGIGGCQCKCSIFGIFCKRVFTITGEKHGVKFEIEALRAEGGFPTTFFSFNKPLAITWENIRGDLTDGTLAAVEKVISVDSRRTSIMLEFPGSKIDPKFVLVFLAEVARSIENHATSEGGINFLETT